MGIEEWNIYYYHKRPSGPRYVLSVPSLWADNNYELYFGDRALVAVNILEAHELDLVLVGPVSKLEKAIYGI